MPKPDELELVSALGFAGSVSSGLVAHPDGEHIIYPLGSTVVVKNTKTGKQNFLHSHTDVITTIALSPDGTKIASGQRTHLGFKAKAVLWDFAAAALGEADATLLELPAFHTGKVQSLSFSPSSKYLASLGGADDNKLAIWNTETGGKVGFAPAASESALTVRFFNGTDEKLVTAGYHHVRRWTIDFQAEKLEHVEANMGTLRRIFKCIAVAEDDAVAYCGTSTGDILAIALTPRIPNFQQAGNELFRKGIRAITFVRAPNGQPQIIAGCGNGSVVALCAKTLKKVGAGSVLGEATSVAPVRASPSDRVTQMYIGTSESNTYFCTDVGSLKDSIQLRSSCHFHPINDVAFLEGLDAVFVTSSHNDIRVWNARKHQELLRIQVPNVTCNAVALPKSGDLILSGWDDGKIRAFKPVSGKLEFVINDAHPNGVTALSVTHNCQTIISGGQEGAVRFWDMRSRKMKASLKEHKGPVTSISVRADDKECISSSDDGSCIQWDLISHRRAQAMFAQTMFKNALYHPDESQVLTCGSDRKLTYWDAFDGTAIRILEASQHQINALDVDREGDCFVAAGNGCQVKVFSYDEGDLVAQGDGHSGAINAVRISPDQRRLVSVGDEGAIFVWSYPRLDLRAEEEAKYK
ncbi:Cilia- and flagella-associated protein 52 [Hondaea fermentalgiana]|uniref:Cilia- and flagella-associated protein 52 n=1 Tax=Hondaea fermentalgiana TaxID=2315210 RepID=A0A2R5G6X4_9STRA|nr:Cilia- and flagella-associated protein 52 [Hondaea fermentalgiana]|eukprot:GBG26806.1 Cilia- and flagella-associated protein 52 [Hondaea fermentalgiana]